MMTRTVELGFMGVQDTVHNGLGVMSELVSILYIHISGRSDSLHSFIISLVTGGKRSFSYSVD